MSKLEKKYWIRKYEVNDGKTGGGYVTPIGSQREEESAREKGALVIPSWLIAHTIAFIKNMAGEAAHSQLKK